MPAPTLSLCRLGDEPAVRVLLELGADPSAGRTSEALRQAGRSHLIAELLLQHGADCLLPAARQRGTHTSLLADFASQPGMHSGAALMLAHLERQRSAGQLQLGSAARAAQLLLASTRRGHQQLFSHSLRCLEKHFTEAEDTAAAPAAAAAAAAAAPAAVAAALTPDDADAILREILAAAIGDASSSSLDRVQALLASSLPLDLTLPDDLGRSVLASAALSASSCAAKVRLLHQAGAPPTTLCDLLIAVDGLSAPGVEALLEAGAPPVDASQVSLRVQHVTSYSCPIHRTLHTLVRCCQHWALRCTALHWIVLHCAALLDCVQCPPHTGSPAGAVHLAAHLPCLESSATAAMPLQGKLLRSEEAEPSDIPSSLRVVEALLAAGYQPTVYRNTAPPAFLFRGGQVLEVFDPFDFHWHQLSPRQAAQPRPGMLCMCLLPCCAAPSVWNASVSTDAFLSLLQAAVCGAGRHLEPLQPPPLACCLQDLHPHPASL